MMPDQRIVGLLRRALAHELTAVQLYLAQARLAALWGQDEASGRFREDVNAELRQREGEEVRVVLDQVAVLVDHHVEVVEVRQLDDRDPQTRRRD